MKRFVFLCCFAALSLGAMAQNTAKLTGEMQRQLAERTASDEQFRIIIGMAEQYDQARMTKSTQNMDMEQRRAYVINELVNFSKASQSDLMLTLTEGKKAGIVEDLKSFWIFNGVSCVTTREMIYALSERKDIAYIESDEMRNMLPESSLETKKLSFNVEHPQTMQTSRDATPLAWNVAQVHADQVWSQYNINGSGVLVAVIDTGLDYYHPDIISHIWQPTVSSITVGETTYALGTFTYDNTTYKLPGYDFVNNDNDPIDDNGHGSHCAGTVAGNGTSGIQTGMAPGTTIMSLKVLSAAGSGSTSAITSAMEFAIVAGADAVSMSLGGHGLVNNATSLSATERAAMVNMLNAGVVALVAAGNEGEYYNNHHTQPNSLTGGASTTWYEVPWNIGNAGNCPAPWRHPDQTLDGGHTAVITIGASNRNDRKATFSSFGPCTWKGTTDLAANGYDDYEYKEGDATKIGLIKPDIIVPGTDITSMYYKYNNTTYIGQNNYNNDTIYFAECGTSMATPGAAGITALIIQAYKAKNGVKPTPAQIDEILEITALPVDFRDTKNNTTGAGRADAKAAIDAIYTNATKPGTFQITNLTDGVVDNGGCVYLSWEASASAPAGYAIYRDNVQVGTTMDTSYVERDPGVGKHTYYVRAIDAASIQSVRSNAAFCTVMPYALADNASITYNGTTATLGWIPTSSNFLANGELKFIDYSETMTAYTGQSGKTVYWGMCFTPEDLRPYQGMSINSIDLVVYKTTLLGVADEKVNLRIYRGTKYGNTTEAPVYSEEFTLEQNGDGWIVKNLELTTPYPLDDITEDLWITFSDYISSDLLGAMAEYPISVGPYDGHNSNVFYMGSSHNHTTSNAAEDLCWSHLPDFGDAYNLACSFGCHLTRTTTYTDSYDLAFNGNNLGTASNVPATGGSQQYNPTLNSGENVYTITPKLVGTQGNTTVSTNYSCPLEAKIVKVDNDLTKSNLNIDQTMVYLVQSNGKLTADNLTCNDPSRLIIEDGGQLVTSSTGVNATMNKNITAYNSTQDHFYFVSSPVNNFDPATGLIPSNGNYDLYYFDQSGTGNDKEWKNYKEGQNATNPGFHLNLGKGYLYANSSGAAIHVAGTLNNTVAAAAVAYDGNARAKGFNLIGNPFPCNAYLPSSMSYYRINGTELVEVSDGGAIAPLEGVFVEVTEAGTVNFNKTEPVSSNGLLSLDLHQVNVEGTSSVVDRASVRFGQGGMLHKFQLDENHSRLYFTRGNENYAVVCAQAEGEMPVNFKAQVEGTYTLNVDIKDLEVSYLHLIDNLTGVETDLLVTPSYTFEATPSDYASRFRLVFEADAAAMEDGETFAFFDGSEWVIGNVGTATLQVIDMMGHLLSSETISGNASMGLSNLSAGVYVMRLVNGDDVKVQKVVVR